MKDQKEQLGANFPAHFFFSTKTLGKTNITDSFVLVQNLTLSQVL